jgi:hypothetical protein
MHEAWAENERLPQFLINNNQYKNPKNIPPKIDMGVNKPMSAPIRTYLNTIFPFSQRR